MHITTSAQTRADMHRHTRTHDALKLTRLLMSSNLQAPGSMMYPFNFPTLIWTWTMHDLPRNLATIFRGCHNPLHVFCCAECLTPFPFHIYFPVIALIPISWCMHNDNGNTAVTRPPDACNVVNFTVYASCNFVPTHNRRAALGLQTPRPIISVPY